MGTDHIQIRTVGADILRGVAILMVIIFHAFGQTYGYSLPWAGWLRDFQSPQTTTLVWFYPVTFGWAGVSLFFVLSGFCIHYSYLRSQQFDISNFFWRRFWRIYPAYFAALLFFVALAYAAMPSVPFTSQFVWHALFIHNATPTTFFGINASFWSIATEMQLYLLYPALLLLRRHFGIEGALVITLLVGLLWRSIAVGVWGLPDEVINPAFTAPFMTWFDWTLGAFVADRFVRGERAFRHPRRPLFFLVPIFVGSTLFKPMIIFGFSLAAGTAAVILDAALWVRWRRSLMIIVLTFIGTISYSLYLWHQPIMTKVPHSIARILGLPGAWCAFFVALLVGSYFSYRFFEHGGIRLGTFLWAILSKRRFKQCVVIPEPGDAKP